jgi:hypothetical protein
MFHVKHAYHTQAVFHVEQMVMDARNVSCETYLRVKFLFVIF